MIVKKTIVEFLIFLTNNLVGLELKEDEKSFPSVG